MNAVPYREHVQADLVELGEFPGLDDESLRRLYLSAADAQDWPLVDAFEAEMDRRWPARQLLSERLREVSALANSARWYARHGIAVFPLAPNSKIPRKGSAGFKDASSDVAVVEAWWAAEPAANIGAPTGDHGLGPTVFDVVVVDGWPGHSTLTTSGLQLPPLLGRARTARAGGWHLFVAPTGSGNRARMGGAGVDYRGAGGYVVMAPSRIDGAFYRWIDPLEALS